MAARFLDCIVNTQNGTLLSSYNSTSQPPIQPSFVFGDLTPVRVRLVEPSGSTVDPWKEIDLTNKLVRIGLGVPGAYPTGGTFTLSYDGDETAALSYSATAAQVQVALNALASITAAGGVTVTSVLGSFRVVFNTAGVTTAITANTAALYPTSSAYIAEAQTGAVDVQAVFVIRLETQPIAYAELEDDLPVAAATVATVRAGASGVSEIQTITFDPVPYSGVYTISFGTAETEDLPWDATAEEIQDALRAEDGTEANLGLISVAGAFPFYTVTFKKSAGNVSPLSVNVSALKVPTGRQGEMSLNTTGVVELLAGRSRADVTLEIELVDSITGDSWTVVQANAVLREDVIGNTPASQTGGPVYLLESVANARFLRFDAAQSLTNGQIIQALQNLSFPTYATLAAANAAEAKIGVPFFNTTSNSYESTTDIA